MRAIIHHLVTIGNISWTSCGSRVGQPQYRRPHVPPSRTSTDWSQVTCKRCLSTPHKGSPRFDPNHLYRIGENPQLDGERVEVTSHDCPVCKRRGDKTIGGYTPRLRILPNGQLWCPSHGVQEVG